MEDQVEMTCPSCGGEIPVAIDSLTEAAAGGTVWLGCVCGLRLDLRVELVTLGDVDG